MKEFKDLLATSVLTEDTKKQITEAFDAKIKAVEDALRSDFDVKYAQKFVTEKTELAQKLFAMIDEAVTNEVEELRQDLKAAKNLEVTYAAKLTAFKEQYAKQLGDKFEKLVAESVTKEFDGLRADLLEARKMNIGKKIIEAVKDEMLSLGLFEETSAIKAELEKAKTKLTENEKELTRAKRGALMEKLLSTLTGTSREVMETILEHVPFENVEKRFNETVSAVIEQKATPVVTTKPASAAGTSVVVESDTSTGQLKRLRKLSGMAA